MTAGPPVVGFTAVSKTFPGGKAVDAVSFEVREGEFFSLLGPSGSGKTTCLRDRDRRLRGATSLAGDRRLETGDSQPPNASSNNACACAINRCASATSS